MKVYKSKNRIVIKNRYGTLVMRRNVKEEFVEYVLCRCGHVVRRGGPQWIPPYLNNRQLRTIAKVMVKNFCSAKYSVYEATTEITAEENKGIVEVTAFLRPADDPMPKTADVGGVLFHYRKLM